MLFRAERIDRMMNGTCGLDVHHESFSAIHLQNVFYMKIRGLQRFTHRKWEQNADFSERFGKFPKGLAIEKRGKTRITLNLNIDKKDVVKKEQQLSTSCRY